MAKINFSSLFQTSLRSYKQFLIFGNDTFVFERAFSFLRHRLNCPVVHKTEGDFIKGIPPQLSLFDSSPSSSLIFIPHVSDKIIPHLSSESQDILILTSEKARAQSKLVTWFAETPFALAIAAYASPLTSRELDFLTEDMALSPSFKSRLLKNYEQDIQGLLSTLKKIHLFGEIPEDYEESFLHDHTSRHDFSFLREAVFLRDKEKIVHHFSLLSESDLIPFLRLLARGFLSLFEISSYRTVPWNTLIIPIFFKEKPLFERALSLWTKEESTRMLRDLLTLENKIKNTSSSLSLIGQFLLEKGR